MNKQKFTKIIQNYHNIPDDDREKLHELAKNYPYSQVIHTLVAKANHDAQTSIASQTLNYAAMYATDRGILKDVIQHKATYTPERTISVQQPSLATKEVDEVVSSTEIPAKKPEQAPVISKEKKKITVKLDEVNPESDLLRDEILLDLEALKKSKATYMEWLQDEETSIEREESPSIKDDNKAQKTSKKPADKKANQNKKKQTESGIKAKGETIKNKVPAKKGTKAKKKTEEKPKKKKKAPKAPKEDQSEIIENFISKEPSITAKPIKSSENQPDLSAASTSFNEDLVSENLANIFINQGKKDKAIDIYKKLIWKFPQKKAYFASRIEELQK